MKKLNHQDVIRMLREEWDFKLERLIEDVDAVFSGKVDGQKKVLVSKGLKLRHKESGESYTVEEINPNGAVLEKIIVVSKDELANDFTRMDALRYQRDNCVYELSPNLTGEVDHVHLSKKFNVSKGVLEDEYEID